MEDKIPYELISKYLTGGCSEAEKEKLNRWKDESAEHAEIFEQMNITWSVSSPPQYEADTEKALKKVSELITEEDGGADRFPTMRLISATAAAILIFFAMFAYLRMDHEPKKMVVASLLNAKPSTYVLPDGSSVTLNGGSMLSYPEVFRGNERRVLFKGEGYFSISSNASKPFIIESGETITRVVGTEFNLRATSDSVVQVFVTEGKVAFGVRESKLREIYIEPGQVGSYTANQAILEKKENSDKNFLSWKNGVLSFDQELLKDALPQIAQLYDIQLVLSDSSIGNTEFTAIFDSMTVYELTQNLELILDVEIHQEGTVFTLK